MFNVEELLEIIKSLESNASFDNICDSLGKKRSRIIFSTDKALIKNILLDNPDIFEFDDSLNIWHERNKTFVNDNLRVQPTISKKDKVLKEIGNWKIMLKSWARNDYHTVIRKYDASIDITMQKDGTCKIWSSHLIDGMELNGKSQGKIEPRPFWYIVNKNELHKVFNDLDISIIELLDNKSHLN